MTEAFIAFVRFEEKLLLLSRNKDDNDFPGLWDGVWGVADTEGEVLSRISDATGLPLEALEYIRDDDPIGIEIGRSFVDVRPILVATSSEEITPTGRYDGYEWIDPGALHEKNCLFADMDMEGADKLFREMYGSVGSFVYIVKTAIGSEHRVVDEMYARLHGSGSLTSLQGEIFSVLHPTNMRGYVFVESSALHHVEKLIGRSGGRDPTARRGISQTPLKNAKTVLPGESPFSAVMPYLEPKAVTSGIEVGCIVEIVSGAFKGEKARVTSVSETKEEVSMELYEQPIPMTLNMRGDHVRVIERVG